MTNRILVIDDNAAQRRLATHLVEGLGYRTMNADGGEAAIALFSEKGAARPDLVLLDLNMPGLDGIQVLGRLRKIDPDLPVIMLTAHDEVEHVVRCMRAGAADYIVKPVNAERLAVSIENALKINALADEVSRLRRHADGTTGFDDLIGGSPGFNDVLALARRAADSRIAVLVEGESGVGKELIARAVQGVGGDSGPFVTVNCGAIPENLVESILFGHVKGAFTGATANHTGKFEEANGGTLFLDEIGELRPDIQVKLLRALQEGEIEPVGAAKSVKVDFRLITATNQDLKARVEQGGFREDLYYRIAVFPLHVPPLRERHEDIPVLVDHFRSRSAAVENKNIRAVSPEAMAVLANHDWPGNVRELENAVFRAVVLCDGDVLEPWHFPHILQATGSVTHAEAAMPAPGAPSAAGPGLALLDASGNFRELEDIEADVIRAALERYKGRMSEVARRLGIGRSTLYRKLRDFDIERFRPTG